MGRSGGSDRGEEERSHTNCFLIQSNFPFHGGARPNAHSNLAPSLNRISGFSDSSNSILGQVELVADKRVNLSGEARETNGVLIVLASD